MTSMLTPPVDGEEDQSSDATKGLRLVDVERIAAERLDGAESGSGEHVGEAKAPDFGATPTAEMPDAQPHGGEEQGPSLSAAPVGDSALAPAEVALPPETEPKQDSAVAVLAVEQGQDSSLTDRSLQVPERTLSAGLAVEERVGPLTDVLEAAAKLAADADAAAAALENLRRLLQRQQPGAVAGPAAAAHRTDTETWPASLSVPPAPPPLPAPDGGSDAGALREKAPQLPVSAPLPRASRERGRLDIRGFLAGFALSFAFGVVLFLFMATK